MLDIKDLTVLRGVSKTLHSNLEPQEETYKRQSIVKINKLLPALNLKPTYFDSWKTGDVSRELNSLLFHAYVLQLPSPAFPFHTRDADQMGHGHGRGMTLAMSYIGKKIQTFYQFQLLL